MSKISGLSIVVLALFAWLGCSSNNSFVRTSVSDALADLGDIPDGSILDVDGDGVGDAIDTDGDGEPDVLFTPPSVPTPTNPDDPPIVRDPSSTKCIPVPAKLVKVSSSQSVSISSLDGFSNLAISISGNGATATFDLSGVTNLERILVYHSGNSNVLKVENATMSVGICNEVSGGSNGEIYEDSCSGVIADLISGTGGGNSIDLRFVPSAGLRYALNGNNHCISAPDGTTILSSSSNDNGHVTHLGDGITCL